MTMLRKFLPLEKIEEQSDGTLHVYGIVTAEQPDLEQEVCDYETTKAFYEKRAAENLQKTSLPGMTPSIMPFREMHQLKVQGAGRTLNYDDTTKTIRMGFHVVDSEAVKMWKAGCFVGFSQGGSYVKQWPDPEFKGCTRYTADPMEVSAVDSPCLPIALVESIKGRKVAFAKADGTTVDVALEVKPPDAVSVRLDAIESLIKRHFSDQEREHDAGTGAALPDGSFPIENQKDLENAIHAYGRAKDKEKAKQHIIARAKSLGLTHLLPEGWETGKASSGNMNSTSATKAATGGGGDFLMKISTQEELTKAAKTLHEHLSGLMEVHKAHGEHMKKAFEGMEAKHEKLGDHIEKCMKAAKDAMDGDEPEKAEQPELSKALADMKAEFTASIEALKTQNTELVAKLAKIPAATPAANAVVDPNRQDDPATVTGSVLKSAGKILPLQ